VFVRLIDIKVIKLFFLISFSLLSLSAFANLPYYPIQLPQDDAAHYENVPYPVSTMTEWWYYNGKLVSKTGRKFGYYITYAYTKLNIKGKSVIVPGFHLQITDIDKQKVYGKRTYFLGEKNFSISTHDLNMAIQSSLKLRKQGDTYLADGAIDSSAGPKLAYSLRFTPTRKALLANETGMLDMWNNTNTYYYSYTHLMTAGYIQIDNEVFEIDPEQSLSWMDHQWGDFVVAPWNYWQWASIQLKNGIELDLATWSDDKTGKVIRRWANVIMPDDSRIYLKDISDFEYTHHGVPPGQKHPHVYDFSVPALQLNLTLTAVAPGQDVNNVWEGISDVTGTYNGIPVEGLANTETTIRY
jgi:predicted secreted hydrolase